VEQGNFPPTKWNGIWFAAHIHHFYKRYGSFGDRADIYFLPGSADNHKGNDDPKRALRTIKEEHIWLNKFSSLKDGREKSRAR